MSYFHQKTDTEVSSGWHSAALWLRTDLVSTSHIVNIIATVVVKWFHDVIWTAGAAEG